MNNLTIIKGNIFTSKCQTMVNTVNCVGVMGAGIALECRLRYPKMYSQYAKFCEEGLIEVGKLWLFKSQNKWILNFPTKKHWKYPTREEYLHRGLQKFIDTYLDKGILSIAFPLLGASNGGLDQSRSLEIMRSYLIKCDIPVEIYIYDPDSQDDLYEKFRERFIAMDVQSLRDLTGLRSDAIQRIREAVSSPAIHQLNQLANVKGIGDKTLEKAFAFMREPSDETESKQTDLL